MNSFTGDPTHGTLGMGVADLNGDGKLDVVQSQGEVPGYEDERVFFGKNIKADTAPPVIGMVEKIDPTRLPIVTHSLNDVCMPCGGDENGQNTVHGYASFNAKG